MLWETNGRAVSAATKLTYQTSNGALGRRRVMHVEPAHLHLRAVVLGDEMNCSSPPFFGMVAQQYVCAGNDHEGFCSVTEATKDPAQCSKQDSPTLCVLQKNSKPQEACNAIRDCIQNIVPILFCELLNQVMRFMLELCLHAV